MLNGKRGLILGVANKRSLAWSIAKSCSAQGAELALTCMGERFEPTVRKLAGQLPGGDDTGTTSDGGETGDPGTTTAALDDTGPGGGSGTGAGTGSAAGSWIGTGCGGGLSKLSTASTRASKTSRALSESFFVFSATFLS